MLNNIRAKFHEERFCFSRNQNERNEWTEWQTKSRKSRKAVAAFAAELLMTPWPWLLILHAQLLMINTAKLDANTVGCFIFSRDRQANKQQMEAGVVTRGYDGHFHTATLWIKLAAPYVFMAPRHSGVRRAHREPQATKKEETTCKMPRQGPAE